MIHRIQAVSTEQTLPYANLALEEALLESVRPGECILYLWQNRRTVVIGRNQNPWKECRVEKLEADGGFLARRLSGGGAVFHDLGNLNFTFLVREEDYDVNRQLEVILRAAAILGVRAEKTGRNDVTVDGRKFSGNAFYKSGGRCYHHGTLLVDVNMEDLTKYLSVSAEKLKSKGVDSVKSRVVNLKEISPGVTVEAARKALTEAFGQVYGLTPTEIPESGLHFESLDALTEKYGSWEWNLGRKIAFETEISRRFDWGEIQLQLKVDEGKVTDARIFSDAMNVSYIAALPRVLVGAPFRGETLAAKVALQNAPGEEEQRIRADFSDFLARSFAQ